MRKTVRFAAAVVVAAGIVTATAAVPAAADGKCVYVYVGNPPTGATVCTP